MPAKTILVIEDDDVSRAGFGLVLAQHGYALALAANGGDGLLYLQEHDPPDLIILDMLMRGMDGWQFIKHRDARWPAIPVLVATALPIGTNEWARSLGAAGYLKKPIDEATLLQQVQRCLESNSRDATSPR
jgi:CheY-like chemotaxis protein